MFTVERYHDFSAGHRVVGHENKCRHLHGHNYRVHFTCVPDPGRDLDSVGRVIDFGVMKILLCEWLEDHWDHKFLLWKEDILVPVLLDNPGDLEEDKIFRRSILVVPFNPTAENMARYLVEVIGPALLEGSGVVLHKVVVEETRKCSASYTRENV